MADALATAIAPFVSSWYAAEYKPANYTTEAWAYAGQWDSGRFDPAQTLDLIRGYNLKFGLTLTDAQLAAGIAYFGETHRRQFGGGFTVESNPVAIATSSVATAVSLRDGPWPADLWAKMLPDWDKGAAYVAQQTAAALRSQQIDQRAASPQMGDSRLLDALADVGISVAFGMAGGALLADLGAAGVFGAEAATGEIVAGDFGSSEILAAGADTSLTVDVIAGDFGTSEILAAGSSPATATQGGGIVFDDWGNTINSDGSISAASGNWDIPTADYDVAVNIYSAGSASAASGNASLADIFGDVAKTIKAGAGALSAITGAVNGTAAPRPAPNLTRAAGQTNLGLPLLAALGFFALRG